MTNNKEDKEIEKMNYPEDFINKVICGDCLEVMKEIPETINISNDIFIDMGRNKENLNKWQRSYYHKRKTEPNFMKIKKDSAKRYYQKNKQQIKDKQRKYRENHREEWNKYRREWRYVNPSGIFSVIRDGAIKRDLDFKITKEFFIKWWRSQKQVCFYCKRRLEELQSGVETKSKRLTVDRLDDKVGYTEDNIVLSCFRCNVIKSNFFTKDEMLEIGKIIKRKSNVN